MESSSNIRLGLSDPILFPPLSYKRFMHVISIIGLPYVEQFNDWAFKKHPMQYNDDLVFSWGQCHTEIDGSQNPDIILNEIMRLWKCKQEDEWLAVFNA